MVILKITSILEWLNKNVNLLFNIIETTLSLKEFIDVNALEMPPPTIIGVLATESWKVPLLVCTKLIEM
jgi:hypothetical protein